MCRFYWLRATEQDIRYSRVNCALGPSKSIRYSGYFVIAGFRYIGVCFHIFYCNSAGLSNVDRYNGIFVIAGFVIARCHCNYMKQILECEWMWKMFLEAILSHSRKLFSEFLYKIFVTVLHDIIGLKISHLLSVNHNPELPRVICTGVVTLFAPVLHLNLHYSQPIRIK